MVKVKSTPVSNFFYIKMFVILNTQKISKRNPKEMKKTWHTMRRQYPEQIQLITRIPSLVTKDPHKRIYQNHINSKTFTLELRRLIGDVSLYYLVLDPIFQNFWCLLASKSQNWVSTILPKIPVLSLVTQSFVTHNECFSFEKMKFERKPCF